MIVDRPILQQRGILCTEFELFPICQRAMSIHNMSLIIQRISLQLIQGLLESSLKATTTITTTTTNNILLYNPQQLLQDYDIPYDVDQEYDLTIRPDLNTSGNIQWYYYKVKIPSYTRHTVPWSFPVTIRFNIINMQKKDSLYNYGMRPAVYHCNNNNSTNNTNNTNDSTNSDTNNNNNSNNNNNNNNNMMDWSHGGFDICYYKNGQTTVKDNKGNSLLLLLL
jgi:hypothetical protein